MKTRHQLRKGRSFEHLRLLFGDISAGSGGTGAVLSCGTFTSFWTGANMAGVTVTATFADAFTETATWVSTGLGGGNATGTNWSVVEQGDTFSQTWVWNNTRGVGLTRIVFDDPTHKTVFDRTSPSPGTPDSNIGLDVFLANTSASFTSSYTNPVGRNGNNPVGDIYQTLTIDFTDPGGMTDQGGTGGAAVGFRFDSDGCVANAQVLADQPTGANGTDLNGHLTDSGGFTWTVAAGTFYIQSNTIQPNSDADYNLAYINFGAPTGAYTVVCDCQTVYASANNAERACVVFFWTDANNYCYVDWQADNSLLQLVQRLAGVETILGTSAQTSVSGVYHTIEVVSNGGYVYFDKTLVISGSAITVTPTAHAGVVLRKVGTPGGKSSWKNFKVFNP